MGRAAAWRATGLFRCTRGIRALAWQCTGLRLVDVFPRVTRMYRHASGKADVCKSLTGIPWVELSR